MKKVNLKLLVILMLMFVLSGCSLLNQPEEIDDIVKVIPKSGDTSVVEYIPKLENLTDFKGVLFDELEYVLEYNETTIYVQLDEVVSMTDGLVDWKIASHEDEEFFSAFLFDEQVMIEGIQDIYIVEDNILVPIISFEGYFYIESISDDYLVFSEDNELRIVDREMNEFTYTLGDEILNSEFIESNDEVLFVREITSDLQYISMIDYSGNSLYREVISRSPSLLESNSVNIVIGENLEVCTTREGIDYFEKVDFRGNILEQEKVDKLKLYADNSLITFDEVTINIDGKEFPYVEGDVILDAFNVESKITLLSVNDNQIQIFTKENNEENYLFNISEINSVDWENSILKTVGTWGSKTIALIDKDDLTTAVIFDLENNKTKSLDVTYNPIGMFYSNDLLYLVYGDSEEYGDLRGGLNQLIVYSFETGELMAFELNIDVIDQILLDGTSIIIYGLFNNNSVNEVLKLNPLNIEENTLYEVVSIIRNSDNQEDLLIKFGTEYFKLDLID
ncbi:hypothetical protein RI065_02115 [Mycoplasmatota bacterium zrk1]